MSHSRVRRQTIFTTLTRKILIASCCSCLGKERTWGSEATALGPITLLEPFVANGSEQCSLSAFAPLSLRTVPSLSQSLRQRRQSLPVVMQDAASPDQR